MTLINVQIEDWQFLDMLLDRCHAWGTSKDNIDLFGKMYQNYIDGGCFDGAELNIMSIVDNDVVSYCSVIEIGEKDFEKLLELDKQGEYDVSCEDFEEYKISYIEAVSDDETRILIRH